MLQSHYLAFCQLEYQNIIRISVICFTMDQYASVNVCVFVTVCVCVSISIFMFACVSIIISVNSSEMARYLPLPKKTSTTTLIKQWTIINRIESSFQPAESYRYSIAWEIFCLRHTYKLLSENLYQNMKLQYHKLLFDLVWFLCYCCRYFCFV